MHVTKRETGFFAYLGLVVIALAVLLVLGVSPTPSEAQEKISVYVSVLPQKFFAERIGGQYVTVGVMVGPGQSPATYEPSPKQMAEISRADVYFRVGVPFENVWMDKLSSINSTMAIVDTREGVPLRDIESHVHEEESHDEHFSGDFHDEEEKDPHIWLNPRLVMIQAKTMYEALVRIAPMHKAYFAENLEQFEKELVAVDQDIRRSLQSIKTRNFMVFHPSWGYFADEYDLVQIPIELQGKEPSARELAQLIQEAKSQKIGFIVVQSQFSMKSAKAVAKAVGAKVIQLDPLAEDYLENLHLMAERLQSELSK